MHTERLVGSGFGRNSSCSDSPNKLMDCLVPNRRHAVANAHVVLAETGITSLRIMKGLHRLWRDYLA
jgi:hypothetical protein